MTGRVKGGKGLLISDNRASGGKLVEMNTLTCFHCQLIIVLNPERKRTRGYCPKCNGYICDDRACSLYCSPIEKCVELAQKYPGLPILPRAYNGGLLVDPVILDKGKVF